MGGSRRGRRQVSKGKKGKAVRSGDALKFVKLANTDPHLRDTHMLSARITEALGRYNEDRGYHAGRPKGSFHYEEADKLTDPWALSEHERTKDGPHTLARRSVKAHPDHPGATDQAKRARLGKRFTRLLRKS